MGKIIKGKKVLKYVPSPKREAIPTAARVKEWGRVSEFGRQLIESPLMSIMILDAEGNIAFVNDEFLRLSETKSPVGKNIFKMPFFKTQGLIGPYRRLIADGIPLRKEGCATANTGDGAKYINIFAVPLRNGHGAIDGVLSMAVDSTDAVTAHQNLASLNAELEKKVAARTEQLSEALQANIRFIADASHELRTPLTIMRAYLDIDGYSHEEIVSSVDEEVNKMAEILEDLNLATAIDGGGPQFDHENVDLVSVLSGTTERLSLIARMKNITVRLSGEPASYSVAGDKAKLEKLFVNLIRNSIKYGKEGGWITVTFSSDQKTGTVSVTVEDNGIGIPKAEIPFLFDRFYRSTLSRGKGEGGFGLGLAICKWIAERHGGTIVVKSTVGKGSCFTVTLSA